MTVPVTTGEKQDAILQALAITHLLEVAQLMYDPDDKELPQVERLARKHVVKFLQQVGAMDLDRNPSHYQILGQQES